MIERPRKARALRPRELSPAVERLRRFVGIESLNARLGEYRLEKVNSNGVQIFRLIEQQPLLEGLIRFEQATMGRRRPLNHIHDRLLYLAEIATLGDDIIPTLKNDSVRRSQIDKLLSLSGSLAPLVLEWQLASYYIRRYEASIEWCDTSTTGPEFIARTPEVEWEVECKLLTPNIAELLRQAQADQLAEMFFEIVSSGNLCGKFSITVQNDLKDCFSRHAEALRADITRAVREGEVDFSSEMGIKISGESARKIGRPLDKPLENLMTDVAQTHSRIYCIADNVQNKPADPCVVLLQGPRRRGQELFDYIRMRMEKAAMQCTRSRGAVLALELTGVSDANVFAESHAMAQMIEDTYKNHPHVAAIVVRAAPTVRRADDHVMLQTPAYVTRSEVTTFPNVASLDQLDYEI